MKSGSRRLQLVEYTLAHEIYLSSGATEADIARALATMASGDTLVLPKGETIAISKGLSIDVSARDITLDLNGATLQQVGSVSVIVAKGLNAKAENVRLGTGTDGNTTVTYDKLPADVSVGAWVKIVSDNPMPGDMLTGGPAPTLLGQALQVASVNGNVVTFKGALVDQANYTTNIRAGAYHSGELVVKNGEIVGDATPGKPAPSLVELRSVIDAHVDHLTIHDGLGYGVSIVNSINATVSDVSVKNMQDSYPMLGIGVHSMSSTGTTVKGLYAENVTHAADASGVGAAPGSSYIAQFGADIGFTVKDAVAIGTRNYAYSWHSESVNGHYENVQAFDSFGFMDARGIGGTVADSGGAGNQRGVAFFEWGQGDARQISMDHINLKETVNYSTIGLNRPMDNQIANSFFESYGPGNLANAEAVTVTNTSYVKAGVNANDVIVGSEGKDLLLGGKGSDSLSGGGGDDYIWGGQDADTLSGGAGRDRFAYHAAAEGGDVITDFQAGANGDVIDVSVIAAKMNWADGDVVANGYARFVQSGHNVLAQVDQDGAAGSGGFVTVATLLDTDESQLNHANFHAELGAPELVRVQQQLQLGDSMVAFDYAQQAKSNALSGDGADNRIDGDNNHNRIYGNAGNDILSGLGGDDLLAGGDGNDQLAGGTGDDVLSGGRGADVLNGGAGTDTATYLTAEARVVADLVDSAKNAGDAAGDRFTSIENLTGSNFSDVLTGNQLANVLDGGKGHDELSGGAGADKLIGGAGDDWLNGGAGKDVLSGGTGADKFYFASVAEAGDTILDFKHGEDHIVLNASAFGINGISDCDFKSATQIYLYAGNAAYAPTTCPTLLYNSTTGQLSFDPDGHGAQKVQFLAVLTEAPQITADDFLIV